jgi:hypothetical protein
MVCIGNGNVEALDQIEHSIRLGTSDEAGSDT